jgi:hypothetical protein
MGGRPLARPRYKIEGNIKVDIQEMTMGGCRLAKGSGQGPVVGSCNHGIHPNVSIEGGEFLDYISDCLHLKDPAAWS